MLKVLYRNTNRIQEHGGVASEVLKTVQPGTLSAGHDSGEVLRDAVRNKDMNEAERTFAAIAAGSPEEAFNSLLPGRGRPYRGPSRRPPLPRLGTARRRGQGTGPYDAFGNRCATASRASAMAGPRSGTTNRGALLPRLFDAHHLPRSEPGTKRPGDEWVGAMCKTIFESSPAVAADAVAAALAEGIDPE